jgi:hypothetical protein
VTWPKPTYAKSHVNKAGKVVLDHKPGSDDSLKAFEIIEHWRSCHGYPVNTFQATLRDKLKRVDSNALVSQRLKRMLSILNKLHRFPSMNLSRMQDFGGLRAVVGSLQKLRALEANYKNSRFKHELVSCKDYVLHPKQSGYRSIHLVYRYNNPKAPEYNGLFVELQIRTKLQHAWATAVETMGTFLGQALKSSEGEEDWLNYFSLCSAAFSHLESSPTHQDFANKTAKTIYRGLLSQTKILQVADKLKGYSVAANNITVRNRRGAYHLILLKFKERRVSIQSYAKRNLEKATEDYALLEKRIVKGESMHAVLVSADSIKSLRQAYPSYFLDTKEFVKYFSKVSREYEKLR